MPSDAPPARLVDAFLGERIERTSSAPLSATALGVLKADLISVIALAEDGDVRSLVTPDGRSLKLQLEQTRAPQPVQRVYQAQPEVSVRIMCRDVAYSLPGQERGRFAACRTDTGSWELSQPALPVAATGHAL
jgi:hypothetical protein